jgi:sugar phosphate isomerase/epimerase
MNTQPNGPLSIDSSVIDQAGGSAGANLIAIREAGFTHLQFSHMWQSPERMTRQEIEQWQAHLDASNLKVLDVHGAHAEYTGVDLWAEDKDKRFRAVELFIHRLEVAGEFSAGAVVCHVPTYVEPSDNLTARYIDSLERIEGPTRRLGLKLAIENHFNAEVAKQTLTTCFERFEPDYIGFALDTGHASIAGNLAWLCKHCATRLKVLHLNDNGGTKDDHWLPKDEGGVVDWDLVVRAIAASPYDRPMQIEVFYDSTRYPSAEDYLVEAHSQLVEIDQAVQIMRRAA